ncbi:uncharacterized protein SCHCODRAFT_02619382 [Schizophyllum commune H4-8]|uniref:Uncharacterized protein n=1 Tax=Schizophyllum commune (strain H4-8 / FGSC 9210) TaxID=578458 RepID=D8Q1H6_SCHCM|nr:uncharacterized protein SCHCODRAFT_02619382 [Schizophyllum commune H4-8]KAI5895427.1 hypothetical protein SCHCODRAFT_02619382 [Schizophyllum commune H4-8]
MSENTVSKRTSRLNVHFEDGPQPGEEDDSRVMHATVATNPTTPTSASRWHEHTLIIWRDAAPNVNCKAADPIYLLGYILDPSKIYASYVEQRAQKGTKEATLNAYLDDLQRSMGICLDNGLKKIMINDEETWLIFAASSKRKEDILACASDEEFVDRLKEAVDSDNDPWIITCMICPA